MKSGGKMTKSELIEIISNQQDQITRKESEVVVNSVFQAIANALSAGGRVELRGFGSFSTKKRQSRLGRNPKTGESVYVPAKMVPHFKPGKELRERVDS
ncbi:MAG: integration host factor subunit beta [Mariprofundaceae bacterium]